MITDLISDWILAIAVSRSDPSKPIPKSVEWSQIYLRLKYISEKCTVLAVCQCQWHPIRFLRSIANTLLKQDKTCVIFFYVLFYQQKCVCRIFPPFVKKNHVTFGSLRWMSLAMWTNAVWFSIFFGETFVKRLIVCLLRNGWIMD